MKVDYTTKGTCSKRITFEIEDGPSKRLHNVKFEGGCPGNLPVIAKLVEGADAETIARMLKGSPCGGRGTSCGDQLALAIEEALGKAS